MRSKRCAKIAIMRPAVVVAAAVGAFAFASICVIILESPASDAAIAPLRAVTALLQSRRLLVAVVLAAVAVVAEVETKSVVGKMGRQRGRHSCWAKCLWNYGKRDKKKESFTTKLTQQEQSHPKQLNMIRYGCSYPGTRSYRSTNGCWTLRMLCLPLPLREKIFLKKRESRFFYFLMILVTNLLKV